MCRTDMQTIPLLKKLTETAGLPGFEKAIRDEIIATWSPLVDEVRTDTLGNLIALKRGSGPEPRRKLMLASHMDEIGLRVTRIQGSFLSITKIGGVDQRLLLGQPVMVHGRRELPGVIGSRPPPLLKMAERTKLVPWDELVVDVGYSLDNQRSGEQLGYVKDRPSTTFFKRVGIYGIAGGLTDGWMDGVT